MNGFIYINENSYGYHNKPIDSFRAVKKDGIIYPLTNINDNKAFVYGIGRFNVNKKNLIHVPVYSEKQEDWNEYLHKYGMYCLFYSISGNDLNSPDCCVSMQQNEFCSVVKCGIFDYLEFTSSFFEFDKIQRSYISNLKDIYNLDNLYIKPQYKILIFPTKPTMDTILDDSKLEKVYFYTRYQQLLNSDLSIINEYNNIQNEIKKFDNCSMDRELLKKSSSLFAKIVSDLTKQTYDEIKRGDQFPICMKDRISYLYGDRASDLYNSMLNSFI